MSGSTDALSDKLLPLEGNAYEAYALDRSWYTTIHNRPKGITFMIRAKNEDQTIGRCIESILQRLKVPFAIVVIDNGSTDNTVEQAKALLYDSDIMYRIVSYLLQIAKAGLETYVTPCNSAHSFPWFTTWCTLQCDHYSHIFRWDADFCMTDALADCLLQQFGKQNDGLADVLSQLGDDTIVEPADAYNVSVQHEDGQYGSEVYLLAVRRGIHYIRSFLWEHWAFFDGEHPPQHFEANQSEAPILLAPDSPKQVSLMVLPQRCHIVHASKLSNVKSYLQAKPWWSTLEPTLAALPHVHATIDAYKEWQAKLGDEVQTFCRSRDPATAPIMRALPAHRSCIVGLQPYVFSELIFQVGLHKTGTVSINRALNQLGIRSMHVEPENVENVIDNHLLKGRPYCNRAAFTDFLWIHSNEQYNIAERRVDALAVMYPRAKFILNTRNVDTWMQSHYRHVVGRNLRQYSDRDLRRLKQGWYAWHAFVCMLFVDQPERLLCFDILRDDPVRLAQFVQPNRSTLPADFWRQAHRTADSLRRVSIPASSWWCPEDHVALQKRQLGQHVAETFGNIIVINLASRKDRLRQFEASMHSVGIDVGSIERLEAIATPGRGWLGCCQSHIAALQKAIDNQWNRVTIFEDDFGWCVDRLTLWPHIRPLTDSSLSFDVLMLGARVVESEPVAQPSLRRLKKAFTASGYVVNRHYFQRLLNNFLECEQMLATVHTYDELIEQNCSLDVHWQSLQQSDNWLCHYPVLGKQIDSHSDVENRFCSHTYR